MPEHTHALSAATPAGLVDISHLYREAKMPQDFVASTLMHRKPHSRSLTALRSLDLDEPHFARGFIEAEEIGPSFLKQFPSFFVHLLLKGSFAPVLFESGRLNLSE